MYSDSHIKAAGSYAVNPQLLSLASYYEDTSLIADYPINERAQTTEREPTREIGEVSTRQSVPVIMTLS